MTYLIEFRPTALRDLDRLTPTVARRIVRKIEHLSPDLGGDVRRLTNFTPEYRLRVGDWRVLFEALPPARPETPGRVIIYRVLHRSTAYD